MPFAKTSSDCDSQPVVPLGLAEALALPLNVARAMLRGERPISG